MKPCASVVVATTCFASPMGWAQTMLAPVVVTDDSGASADPVVVLRGTADPGAHVEAHLRSVTSDVAPTTGGFVRLNATTAAADGTYALTVRPTDLRATAYCTDLACTGAQPSAGAAGTYFLEVASGTDAVRAAGTISLGSLPTTDDPGQAYEIVARPAGYVATWPGGRVVFELS